MLSVSCTVSCVSQEQSGVPTLTGPIARRINVANSTGGEEELISAVIPDEVLVKILEERLAVSWLSFMFCDICSTPMIFFICEMNFFCK